MKAIVGLILLFLYPLAYGKGLGLHYECNITYPTCSVYYDREFIGTLSRLNPNVTIYRGEYQRGFSYHAGKDVCLHDQNLGINSLCSYTEAASNILQKTYV